MVHVREFGSMHMYPQIGRNRLSGDEDEWRILIRWTQGEPTSLYTIPQALCEAERLRERDEHEIARRILQAADHISDANTVPPL
jgi:hypothetical protein